MSESSFSERLREIDFTNLYITKDNISIKFDQDGPAGRTIFQDSGGFLQKNTISETDSFRFFFLLSAIVGNRMRLVAEAGLRELGITEVLTAEAAHVFVTAELPMELQVLEEVLFRNAAEGIMACEETSEYLYGERKLLETCGSEPHTALEQLKEALRNGHRPANTFAGILAMNLLETGIPFLALNEKKIEPPLVLTRRDGKMILKDYSGILAENGRLIRKEDEVEAEVSEVFLIAMGNPYLSAAEQEDALHHLEADLRMAMPYLSLKIRHEEVQPVPSFRFTLPDDLNRR